MKALAFVAGLFVASIAAGQDNFPDVPDDFFERRFEAGVRAHGWYRGPERFMNSVINPVCRARGVMQTLNALRENLQKRTVEIERLLADREVGDTKSLVAFSVFLSGTVSGGEVGVMWGFRLLVSRHSSYFERLGTSRKELLDMLEACKEPLAKLSKLYGQAIALSRQESADFRFSPKYEDLAMTCARLNADGWLVSTDLQLSSPFHNPAFKRTAFAKAAMDTLPKLRVHLDTAVRESGFVTKDRDKIQLGRMHRDREDYAIGMERGLRLWIREFGPEIRALGGSLAKLEGYIVSCREPLAKLAALQSEAIRQLGGAPVFPDVPYRHWAGGTIQELRDAGLLKGYPDRKLRG